MRSAASSSSLTAEEPDPHGFDTHELWSGRTIEEPSHYSEEVPMAVVFIQEFPIEVRSTKNYDYANELIGDGPFEGLIAHSAGFDDDAGVFRIFDVWETREQAERFLAEHVQPVVEQGPNAFPSPGAFTPPTRDAFYELHHVVESSGR